MTKIKKALLAKLSAPLAIGGVAASVLAAAAAAYFLATAHTTHSFAVGGAPTVTLAADPGTNALTPGGSNTVDITISNPPTNGDVHVGTITGSVDATSLPSGCDATWFTVAPDVVDATITSGNNLSTSTTLSFDESGTDQSACENATPTLDVSLG